MKAADRKAAGGMLSVRSVENDSIDCWRMGGERKFVPGLNEPRVGVDEVQSSRDQYSKSFRHSD